MALLVVRVPVDEADMAADWLWSLGTHAIEERQPHAAEVTLVAGFDDEDLALAARSVTGERWPTRFEHAADEAEWRDVWLRHLEPVQVGAFLIHPPWQRPPTETGDAISLDPGRAFGSGHHPSTQLAIEALTESVRPGDRVLDVGSGTGVLAIVAKRLGAGTVLGIDVDEDIAELARTNAEANGLSSGDGITFTTVTGAPGQFDAADHDFDVVVANMTIGTIRPLFSSLDRWWSRSLILSGLLDDQGSDLLALTRGAAQISHHQAGWRCVTIGSGTPEPT